MSWSNYHGHCFYCDGKESPDAYIAEAESQNMRVIGFSCHAPVPFDTTWTMPADRLPQYLDQIENLKNSVNEGLLVLKSLEVDYIPGIAGPYNPQILASHLDYVVGSVHYVEAFPSGVRWSIDNNNTEFESGITQIFNGDVKLAVTRYFELQMEMCTNEAPDILGHMDKIRMHNLVKPHFNEFEDWYIKMLYDTLITARDKGIIVEINTKYFTRNGMLFPSQQHFKWMHKNGIKVTISSDAHKPASLTSGFFEVAAMLLEAGYREIWEWNGSGFAPFGFTKEGLAV
jgi:histidinol-phosphatase (PHP family)